VLAPVLIDVLFHTTHSTGTKLLLNVRLNRLLKVTRQSDKMVQLVCVNYADVQNNTAAAATIGTYLVKTKTTEVSRCWIKVLHWWIKVLILCHQHRCRIFLTSTAAIGF